MKYVNIFLLEIKFYWPVFFQVLKYLYMDVSNINSSFLINKVL